MNIAFRIIIWYLIFNICTGLMLQAFPVFNEHGATNGLTYNQNDSEMFITGMNSSVSPDSSLTDESSTLDAAMNYIQLGFIWRWLSVIDGVMFGSLKVLHSLVGGYFETEAQDLIVFGFLRGLVTLGYILAAFSLWTEKDI